MISYLLMKEIPEISVFFPAYNEEKNIGKTVKDTLSILEKIAVKYEILIIDDGSLDNTGAISDKLAKENKIIRVIHHKPNQGYGAALKSGFTNAEYEWIATIDADGQFDFSEIEKLYKKTAHADIVIGYRLNRQDSVMRKINGWLWTFLNNLLFGIKVKDVDCAFKLVNKKVIQKITPLESTRGGMISPELLAKAKKAGFVTDQVPVHHYPRHEGKQTGANLKVIIKSFVDLFKLWIKLSF